MVQLLEFVNLAWIGNLYMWLGVISSMLLKDYVCKPYDKKRTKIHNIARLIFETTILTIFIFLIRGFVQNIPNPIEKIFGHVDQTVHINGGAFLGFAFTLYVAYPLKSKFDHILD